MASTGNISSIALPNGSIYDLKDAAARLSVAQKSAVSVDGQLTDVNMVHMSLSDYGELVATSSVVSSNLYVISTDYVETYGQQIKNVAPGSDLSDAVNYSQLLSGLGTKQPAGNYLTAVPSTYKTYAATLSSLSSTYSLTSHTHSNYALTSHAHGNVTSAGTLTATGIAIANGDSLVVVDSDQSSKIAKTTITFDGSTTTQFLSKKGTWQTALTAVPSTYKTYAQTKSSLSNEGYATSADTQLTKPWVITYSPDWSFGDTTVEYDDAGGMLDPAQWYFATNAGPWGTENTDPNATELIIDGQISAVRGAYQLGDQSDMLLQPAGNYLTAVPDDYKTYAQTKSSLSTVGYAIGVKVNGEVKKAVQSGATADIGIVDIGTVLTAHQAVSAVYSNQHIYLSANGARVGNIDCSDFIKDGMLSTVELCSDQLIFIFNAESGKTAISVALSNFIDETNYYTKSELTGTNGVLKGYVPTTRTVAGQQLTDDVTAATISSAIGLGSYALDISALHKTGDETAAGKKTFSDAFTVGTRKSGTYGTKSFTYGLNNLASGEGSFAGGQNCVASESYAHAEGYATSALVYISHAEGQNTVVAQGAYCGHAEGYSTQARGYASHAEGNNTVAVGGQSHAEGQNTRAGDVAHAEGYQTSALLSWSHAEGFCTKTQHYAEHAQGYRNFSNFSTMSMGNAGNTLDSIGIGWYDQPKNATEVMQNGDAYFLGVGGYDGTNAVSATSKPLAAVLSAKADIDSLGYALSTATGTLSSGSYVYDVTDRTITTIGINQSSTPVIVRLPAASTYARDFIVRIEISSAAAPSFTFTNTDGLMFESEDDDWAVMEPGLNIVSFTETKR